MPLHADVDLRLMAEKTHGFVGADVESLAKEAAMLAIRELLPKIDLDKPIPPEVLIDLQIKMKKNRKCLRLII